MSKRPQWDCMTCHDDGVIHGNDGQNDIGYCPDCKPGLSDLKPTKARCRFVPAADPVNRPAHYTAHPSGVECIAITEHFSFCLGNAMKYLWRSGLKGDAIEDLKKSIWYINREIANREKKESA